MNFGIDCSTVGSQFDCAAECINALSCSQLPTQAMACLTATCTDGGTGDGGAGEGGASDGGMINACSACVGQSCLAAAGACLQDPACAPWLMCTNACNSASPPVVSCFQACDAMYAGGKAHYDPVYACACSMCGTQCAMSDPCAAGMDGGP
jgi:hypothetical protein